MSTISNERLLEVATAAAKALRYAEPVERIEIDAAELLALTAELRGHRQAQLIDGLPLVPADRVAGRWLCAFAPCLGQEARTALVNAIAKCQREAVAHGRLDLAEARATIARLEAERDARRTPPAGDPLPFVDDDGRACTSDPRKAAHGPDA